VTKMVRVLIVILVVQCSFLFVVFTVVIVKHLLVQPLQLCPETPPGLGHITAFTSFAVLRRLFLSKTRKWTSTRQR